MQTIAERLDELFRMHRHPSGREYTYQEVADGINGELDQSSIRKIRKGITKNPGRNALLLLSNFFGVSASYFFPEEAPPRSDDEAFGQLVARRAAALSPSSRKSLLDFLDFLRGRDQ